MDIEKLKKKAQKKHGENRYGKFLFWSNAALRAFPNSPIQKELQAEAEKFRT